MASDPLILWTCRWATDARIIFLDLECDCIAASSPSVPLAITSSPLLGETGREVIPSTRSPRGPNPTGPRTRQRVHAAAGTALDRRDRNARVYVAAG